MKRKRALERERERDCGNPNPKREKNAERNENGVGLGKVVGYGIYRSGEAEPSIPFEDKTGIQIFWWNFPLNFALRVL